MRKLTLDDVRLTRNRQIVAAPLWAYEFCPLGGGMYTRIKEVWTGLLAHLRQLKEEDEAQLREMTKEYMRCAADESAPKEHRDWARYWLSMHKDDQRHDDPSRGKANIDYPTIRAIKTCKVCDMGFFALGNTVTCSPACARTRRNMTR